MMMFLDNLFGRLGRERWRRQAGEGEWQRALADLGQQLLSSVATIRAAVVVEHDLSISGAVGGEYKAIMRFRLSL